MKGVVVYDDVKHYGETYAESLRRLKVVTAEFDVECMSHEDFTKEMEELERRQMRARRKKTMVESPCRLDKTSVFVIDFDLLKPSDPKIFLTGEVVAYLVRCFSECSYIMGLNQYGHNAFDLTLRGHPESYADLNVGSRQLDNAGLWGGGTRGFRPWYWPQVPRYLESFQDRMNDVKKHVDDPICEVLGIKDVVKLLPRSVSEFIGGTPSRTTFRDFVARSGNGLRGRDKHADVDTIAKIGAARVSKWLERLVLPGQDILVDAPHLASRYPSLLEGDHSRLDTWNKTTDLGTFESLNLDHKAIEEFRFKKDMWLSRPAWFWQRLSECRKIKEVSEPWKREATKYVFCEDSSSFHERKYCREFVAESDSPYVRRFLRYFKDVDYRPKVRLFQ